MLFNMKKGSPQPRQQLPGLSSSPARYYPTFQQSSKYDQTSKSQILQDVTALFHRSSWSPSRAEPFSGSCVSTSHRLTERLLNERKKKKKGKTAFKQKTVNGGSPGKKLWRTDFSVALVLPSLSVLSELQHLKNSPGAQVQAQAGLHTCNHNYDDSDFPGSHTEICQNYDMHCSLRAIRAENEAVTLTTVNQARQCWRLREAGGEEKLELVSFSKKSTSLSRGVVLCPARKSRDLVFCRFCIDGPSGVKTHSCSCI